MQEGVEITIKKYRNAFGIICVRDQAIRDAILQKGCDVQISGVPVRLEASCDKESGQEVPTNIYAGWGKPTPVSRDDLLKYFEDLQRNIISKKLQEPPSKKKRIMSRHEGAGIIVEKHSVGFAFIYVRDQAIR